MSNQVVLLISHSPIRRLFQITLLQEGFRVVFARDKSTLAEALDQRPGLIIFDAMPQSRDEYEMRQVLMFDERCRDVPIIVLSDGEEFAKIEGQMVGATVSLTQPFGSEELREAISRCMQPA